MGEWVGGEGGKQKGVRGEIGSPAGREDLNREMSISGGFPRPMGEGGAAASVGCGIRHPFRTGGEDLKPKKGGLAAESKVTPKSTGGRACGGMDADLK